MLKRDYIDRDPPPDLCNLQGFYDYVGSIDAVPPPKAKVRGRLVELSPGLLKYVVEEE